MWLELCKLHAHKCFYFSPSLFSVLWLLASSDGSHVDCLWNVMAHGQKPDFIFRRNGRVYLNRRGRQFSRILEGALCASACRVCTARVSLCSAVMWRLLATHSILLFPSHFSSRASPSVITFQLESTGSFLGVNRSGRSLDHPPHPAPRLNKA